MQRDPSAETVKQIVQIVLRLKQANLAEDEQIAALQQIVILTISTLDQPMVARDSGAIEIASFLIGQTQNMRLKQLCGAVITLIGQAGAEEDEIDWACVCSPLVTMLFSTNESFSNTGKIALINILGRNDNAEIGLLQINFMDRSAQILHEYMANSSSQTTITRSPIIVMNILEIIDKILTVATQRIPNSQKLNQVLEKMKSGGSREIQRKSRILLSLFEEQSEQSEEMNENVDVRQLEIKLKESEQKRIEAEQGRKEAEQINKEIEIGKREAEVGRREADERTRIAEEQKRIIEEQKRVVELQLQDEQRRRIELEQKLQEEQRKRTQAEQAQRNAEQGKINAVQQKNEEERKRIDAEQGKRNADERTRIAEQGKSQEERKRTQAEQSQRNAEQYQRNAEQSQRNAEQGKREAEQKTRTLEERIRVAEEEKKQKDEKIYKIESEAFDILKSINNEQDYPPSSYQDWVQLKKQLEVQENGTQQQIEQIRQQKINTVQKIITLLIGQSDDDLRREAVEVGIIDAIIKILNNWPLDKIGISLLWGFFNFTYPCCIEVKSLITAKNPYPAFVRLFDHPDTLIIERAVLLFFNAAVAAASQVPNQTTHSHFQIITNCNGINKLYALFKRNINPYIQKYIAFSFAMLYQAREIPDATARREIIAYIKPLSRDSDKWTSFSASWILDYIAQNAVNRAEILKDGFVIPKWQK
ncbi:MAG: hypothetical protein EZS28_011805 [Streblomastix strix]|uniref:Uncharacterized protein n=1 Tax=Streblomastix strix TaxID=222440 RepID=A0A5J4WCK3_9EUKA|nr:MAG: hypothetical protein EZS28_011805 [Streblomastix strix]